TISAMEKPPYRFTFSPSSTSRRRAAGRDSFGFDCVLLPEVGLKRPRVMSLGRQGETAGVPQQVLLGVDGISDFNGLDSRKHELPLHLRKTKLARLMARRPEGIFVSDFEQGQIGPDLFRHFRRLADTLRWYDVCFRA